AFHSFDVFSLEASFQNRLPATPHYRIKQKTAEHRANRSKQWKIKRGAGLLDATADDQVVVDFRQREERRIERADNDHGRRGVVDWQRNHIALQPMPNGSQPVKHGKNSEKLRVKSDKQEGD